MKAKFVSESIKFERGRDPKDAMGIGMRRIKMTEDMMKIMERDDEEDRDQWGDMHDEFRDLIGLEDYESIGYIGMFNNHPEFEDAGQVVEDIEKNGSVIKSDTVKFTPSQPWHSDITSLSYKLYSQGLLDIGGGNYYMRRDLINY